VHYYLNLWILFSFILTNHLVKSYRSASEYLKMVACLIVVRAGGKLTPQEQSQRPTGQSRRYNVTPIFLARLPHGIRHVEARGRFCTTILSGPESTDLWIIPLFSSLSKNYVVYSSHAAPPLKECLALSMTHLLLLFLQGGHRSSTSREHAGSGKLLGI